MVWTACIHASIHLCFIAQCKKCEALLNAEQGVWKHFNKFGLPDTYCGETICTWTITAPAGLWIQMKFMNANGFVAISRRVQYVFSSIGVQ